MFVTLDILFIFLMVLALIFGLGKNWSGWRQKQENKRTGDWAGLLSYLFFNRSIGRRFFVGWAHFVLVWGFVIFLLVVLLDQLDGLISPLQASAVSFILDITGAAMLISVLFFLLKKGFESIRSKPSRMKKKSLLSIILIGLIVVTGFWSEGTRISILNNGFDISAPIGSLVAQGFPASPVLMQVFIRIHIYLVLLFFATLPFGYMRHIAGSAVNILHRTDKKRFPAPRLVDIGTDIKTNSVEEIPWNALLGVEACVSCGRCIENCPAALSDKPLFPGEIIQKTRAWAHQSNPAKISSERIAALIPAETAWSCTNCMACIEHCPVYSRPMDLISMARRQMVLGNGELPGEARTMIKNLSIYKDTNGKGAASRNDWAIRLNVEQLSESNTDTEVLLWTGCSGAFHPRNQETTQALVKILRSAGIQVKTLGGDEMCCGDPAKRLGDEALFLSLAKKNIRTLSRFSYERIVTACPHCLHTLKTDYKSLGAMYRVSHATEYIAELLAKGKLNLKYKPKSKKVTIHDPCYLGRALGIYQPLRDVVRQMEGIQIKEMKRNKASSFCCGAGGGHMWLHDNQGRNMNQVRAEEAHALSVDQVATACPYCLTMFEDGLGSIEAETKPKVNDLVEMVADCLE